MTPKKSDQKTEFKNKIKDLEATEFNQSENFFDAGKKLYTEATPPSQRDHRAEDVWMANDDGYEGQLAVDVYFDAKNVYLKSIIGGIRPEDIEVHLNNDMITIKGKRLAPDTTIPADHYYVQECYWGGFSRSIILPVDIITDQVEAKIEHGVLTIVLPKSNRPKNALIPVKEVH